MKGLFLYILNAGVGVLLVLYFMDWNISRSILYIIVVSVGIALIFSAIDVISKYVKRRKK